MEPTIPELLEHLARGAHEVKELGAFHIGTEFERVIVQLARRFATMDERRREVEISAEALRQRAEVLATLCDTLKTLAKTMPR